MPEREITTLEKKRSRRITLNMPIKERVATTTVQLVLVPCSHFGPKGLLFALRRFRVHK